MYEMWAEHDPAVNPPSLVWHVVAKEDASKSLCGRFLEPGQRVVPGGSDGQPGLPDSYCDPCLVTVRESMAATAG
ncbi:MULTISPECIES: hypothetical protein [unclassified Streptomyces]|uniref:hypothetical protein n=1 Tax=Streptomycetaceae TaxID=2062 RepID=UPI002E7A8621|nr:MULTISPECIES: hypothetical protein [unclassified Streptomyces]MED7952885.1 hypothetical protein [Streptomyces sp. BE303]MEE1825161.1 hypothetical protein [Streptomyces sp. BE20]